MTSSAFTVDTLCAADRIALVNPVRNANDMADLRVWLAQRPNLPLGIDSETNAADPWDSAFRLRAVQIADTQQAWVIDAQAFDPAEIAKTVSAHKFWVAHFSEAEVRFVGRGAPGSFDMASDIPHVVDLQVLLAWYDPRTVVPSEKGDIDPRIAHSKGLKPTTTRELSPALEDAQKALHSWFHNHAPKGSRTPAAYTAWGFANIPFDTPEYLTYSALDPLMTIRLWEKLSAVVRARGVWSAVLDDLSTQWDIDRATFRGLPVDAPYALWLDDQLNSVILDNSEMLNDHGVSRTAMGPAVGRAFTDLGVVSPKQTDSGAPSWDREVMKELADIGPIGNPARRLARTIIRTRQAIKFGAAYVSPMLDSLERDGRVHCSMRAIGTVTSRMSARDPALQQLPKKDTRVRAAYGGVPGWVFVSCDFAQGEPRVMAALSGDQRYIDAINQGDVNNAVAAESFGSAFNPAEGKVAGTTSYLMRQGSKAGFLAKCYGGGVTRVASTLGVPLERGREVIDRWEDAYRVMFSRSAQLNQGTSVTLANGWVVPLWDRYTVDDADGLLLYPKPSRKAMNYETQGTQRMYLVRAWREMVRRGWGWSLAMFMHDEILLHVPEFMAVAARDDLAECMTMDLGNGVTMLCEATIDGRTWLPQPDSFAIDELKAVEA